MRTPRPLADRLSDFTQKVDGACWLWTGPKNHKGYGKLKVPGDRWQAAHRLVYLVYNGPLVPGMFVCHTCDTPACVRPDHLFLGTPKDNVRDMIRKGRARYVSPGATNPLRGEENPSSRLTQAQVEEARSLYGNGGVIGMKALAAKYGVSWQAIQKMLSGGSWGGPKRSFPGGRPARE